jgi:hypothetical protein
MITAQWPREILPIVRREWDLRLTAYPSVAAQFYNVMDTNAMAEYSQGVGELGQFQEYQSATAEGKATIESDSFSPLYEKTFTIKQYAKLLTIDRILLRTAQTNKIIRKAQNFGTAAGKTIAVFQSSVFNNAFSSSYVGGDAKALCANDHPRNMKDSTSIDNKGTSALSYAAVIATIQAGKKMTDDRGDVMPIVYDTLYVPTELVATAIEETKGLMKPGVADNYVNALTNGAVPSLRIIEDPLLTDANNWFMIDSAMAKEHLLWYWLDRPGMAIDANSDYNLVAGYRGYFSCSYGFDDFRFIYGHEV